MILKSSPILLSMLLHLGVAAGMIGGGLLGFWIPFSTITVQEGSPIAIISPIEIELSSLPKAQLPSPLKPSLKKKSRSMGAKGSATGEITPFYPRIAQRLGEEGRVEITLHTGPSGTVTSYTINRSSGSRHLDRAAVAAVKKAKFRRPTEKITFVFQLSPK